ncbi:MAG: hypothetical protein AABX74_00110 [Nanoarchaeota archaeon]
MTQSYEGNFPIMDALVTVHYDNIDPNHFVRLQVESRIGGYLAQDRKVYNISTSNKPNSGPHIVDIASPLENPEESNDFGLEQQIEQLLKELRIEGRELSVEINGVVFFMCVRRVRNRLMDEPSIKPSVNYDCTDSVINYHIEMDAVGRRLSNFGSDGLVPIPSPEVYGRYQQHIKKFPKR